MTARLISIIGPPGVGKTTLAEAMSAAMPARLIREDYAGNPFLAASYLGQADAGLAAQIYYLMSRAKQLATSTWPHEGLCVSDYGYCQDRIFARRRLSPADLVVYERVAERIDPLVRAPDVLIHLDARTETLLERIARRGRGFEKAMTPEFLDAMRAAYADPLDPCEILRVDCDAVDIRDAAQRKELIAEALRMFESRTEPS